MSKEITAIWVTDDVVLITIKHLPRKMGAVAPIFESFASHGINVDLISQTPLSSDESVDLSFSVAEKDLNAALELVAAFRRMQQGVKVDVNPGNTKITLYGEPMRDTPGCAARIFRVLADIGTEVKLITTSEVEVSILIDSQDEDKTIAKFTEVFSCGV